MTEHIPIAGPWVSDLEATYVAEAARELGIREPAPSSGDLSNPSQAILGCATQLLFRIALRPFIWLSWRLASEKGTR